MPVEDLVRKAVKKLSNELTKLHPEVCSFLKAAKDKDTEKIKKDLPDRKKWNQYANQIDMDRLFTEAVCYMVRDKPYLDTVALFNGASKLFEGICRTDGFHEGIARRYLDIASVVPRALRKTEDDYVRSIGEFETKEFGKEEMKKVWKMLWEYTSLLSVETALELKYGASEKWRERAKVMDGETKERFLDTIREAGSRLKDHAYYPFSKEKVRVAARRAYNKQIENIVGEFEGHYYDLREEDRKEMKEYMRWLAEKFDSVPVPDKEKQPKVKKKVEMFLGMIERYDNDPRVYRKFRESMEEIKHLLRFGGRYE